jgi:hypothetical protein
MRVWLLGAMILWAGPAMAGDWALELGLSSGIGVSRFAEEPTPSPPPSNPNNLFAIFPPSATGQQGTGLAGAVGLSAQFTRKRRWNVGLDLLASGQTLKFEEDLVFPDGTKLKRATAWDWSGFRPTATVAYAYPIKLGSDWALAPRIGGGLWYEKVTGRRKLIGVDGGTPTEVAWRGAPEDDWGWIAVVGMDWLRLGAASGPKRIGLEARWREGRALAEASAGADKPVRVIEAVLTVPWWMVVL